MGTAAALNIILQLLNVGIAAGAAIQQYAAIKAQVEAMIAAGRDPTDEEWSGLLDTVDGLSARLAAAGDRLNP